MKYEGLLIDAEDSWLTFIGNQLNPNHDRLLFTHQAYVSPDNIEEMIFNHPKVSIPRDLDLFKVT